MCPLQLALPLFSCNQIEVEGKLRHLSGQMLLLLREVPRLAAEDAHLAEVDTAAMRALTAMRNARRMALFDAGLQLRLKAGQVRVCC